ncbi:MAG: 23S rRNA (uracil-5-)-methyltransferase RumA [Epulopiscium sp. Nele67-Bin005]|nr:MAG: 23S rRNA (uracil-5-)-methyltransferase RumA [Epulopiscium sp. Nele67-Bin005]
MAKKQDIIQATIERVKFPNKGICEIEDGVRVEVADTFSGQDVQVRLCKKRKGKWEGRLVEVLENPTYFVKPECEYFGQCGGCALQPLPYEKQLERKFSQVKQILADAEITEFEDLGILGSPNVWNYRNKMEFSFGDSYKDGPMALGMHKKRSTYDIITVDGCKIVNLDFSKILRCILDYVEEKNLPFYKKKIHEGFVRYLVIRQSETTKEILVNLITSSQINFDFSELCNKVVNLDLEGKVAGFFHTLSDNLADAVKPEQTNLIYGQDFITEKILGLDFKISPYSFFQTNTTGAELLYKTALDLLSGIEEQTVFDLYSGTGTIAQIMALKAKSVVGIEIVEEAVVKARENAKLNGLENCNFIAGDVLIEVDNLQTKPDTIVLDPPREGIHPKAIQKIMNFGAKELLYISCKPTALAKDLVILQEGGYKIEKIGCVDMFPQTVHIETIVLLSKK